MADVYTVLHRIAGNPALGRLRAHRSAPFQLVAAGRHFVVYDTIGDQVVILTVLHQVRDIERITADMGSEFMAEIEALRGARKDGDGDRPPPIPPRSSE